MIELKCALLLMTVLLVGCQQKSEIDKCVSAQLESLEENYQKWVKDGIIVHKEEDYKIRMKEAEAISRKECLRAAAGKS